MSFNFYTSASPLRATPTIASLKALLSLPAKRYYPSARGLYTLSPKVARLIAKGCPSYRQRLT